jgi:hypothetical protein
MPSASRVGGIVPKCPHCGGRVEPKSNGNGSVADRCTSCGRSPDAALAAARAPRFDVATGSKCRVKDCPGTLDGSGQCPCCARREAWAAENIPKRQCQICEGEISGRGARKYCEACKPIAQRASIAKWDANQPTKKAVKK